MTRRAPTVFEFTARDDPELLSELAEVARSGTGWINLEPVIDAEFEPPGPGPFAFLGGSIHKVPVATWLPGRRLPDGTARETSLGLQHAAGPRVARRLRDLGLAVPEGWRITQDHPRRGLVVAVPATVEPATAVAWLLSAAEAVCQVPATGRWRASVHVGIG